MYSSLSEEVPAPDIKFGQGGCKAESVQLAHPDQNLSESTHFCGAKKRPYSSYRNANKIEIPFLKLSMPAASPSTGAAVPYLRDDLTGTPLHDVLSAPVLSLLLDAV